MKYKSMLKSVVLLAMFLLGTYAATAQFTATGRVTDKNGEGLIGATIAVVGGGGTTADLDGNYRVQVPGASGTLVIAYTGFKSVTMQVTAASTTADATLEEDFASLDEVIVTGLATNIKRANAANAVSLISAKELTGTTIQQTVDGALYGKLTGATINANSGAPGGGISMKFRA